MAVLFPASTSHRQMTAIHSADTSGNRKRMMTQTMPPPSTNGFRRPQRGLQVLSLIAPMNGWISRPVIGPAMFRIGRLCAAARRSRNNGFTAVCVSPKLNWTPKNPRFIQAMFLEVIKGRRSSPEPTSVTSVITVDTRHTPSRDRPDVGPYPHAQRFGERSSALTIDVDVARWSGDGHCPGAE